MKRMFHKNKLDPGDDETIAEFSRSWIVPLKFMKDYVDHLAQIEMRKEKRRTESERQSSGVGGSYLPWQNKKKKERKKE